MTESAKHNKKTTKSEFSPSDLKSILLSKRANLYYLEYCRVLCNGGRVEFVTDEGKRSLYWNIPIANTTTVLLGNGTSVTQAAMRELAKAGVLVGFCGGGGTPLFSANEMDVEVAWFSPQSEYRPTKYLQHWVRFWFDDAFRLHAAKALQTLRLARIRQHWTHSRSLREAGFLIDTSALNPILDAAQQAVLSAADTQHLLVAEAHLTKQLYKMAVNAMGYGEFTRGKRGSGSDPANRFLDHDNLFAPLALPENLAISAWAVRPYMTELTELAETKAQGVDLLARRYGALGLPKGQGTQVWAWHPMLGFRRRAQE